ncbi:MAG: S-layer homology domain-containing protein [Egicoccus sp.]
MFAIRRLSLTTALLLPLAAALLVAGAAPADAAPARTANESAAESHLVDEHNRARAGSDRAALRAATDLTDVARAWSDEMARTGNFRHNPSVSGQICCWTAWGENIAWAGPVDAIGGWEPTADRIMRGWLDSPGHRDNLMSATFDEVGIGVSVASNGRMYATAVFRRSDGTAAPASQPVPQARSIDRACPPGEVPSAGFTDVGASQARAVDCLAWWDVAQGTSARAFSPQRAVTRAQFAAFLARALEETGGILQVAPPPLTDLTGNIHATAIGDLAGIGIIGGFTDGTFRPNQTVTRGQMASMLVKAAEYRTGERLRAPSRDWFIDDSGTHERAINQIADAGWAAGDGNGHFGASSTLQRGHLALFVARWLDTMVAEHGASLPR